MRVGFCLCIFLFTIQLPGPDCQAADVPLFDEPSQQAGSIPAPSPPNSVFLFGGQFTTVNISGSLIPTAPHESNYIVGGAYERDFYQKWGFVLGAEVGLADRFGMGTSVEVWAGPKVIYTGLVLFDSVRIAPGLTFGLSAVTKPVGIEATRQAAVGGNATLLGYLGLELATSFLEFPDLEFVYRLQHRSGAHGIFGTMWEGANANVFGVRYRF
jgi:hypothetical protein